MKTNTLRLAHSADWHLLELQYGRRDRADDFLFAAVRLIETSAAAGCVAIVLAGDTLNKPTMSAGLFASLTVIEMHLKKHNLVMLVITGNHDEGSPNWFSAYTDNIRKTGGTTSIIPLGEHPQGVVIQGHRILGFDHCAPEELVQKVQGAPAASMLVIHAALDVVSSGSSSSTSVSSVSLPLERFAYVACGDIHIPAHAVLKTPFGETICAMPGAIELTAGGEPLEKSFYVVELSGVEGSRATVTSFQTIPLAGNRPVVPIRVDTEADVDSAIARLRAAAPQDPIVFVRFNPDVPDVRTRLNAILAGTNSIVRMAPYDDGMDVMRAVGRASGVEARQQSSATLLTAFEKLCPPNMRYHALASRLLANPATAGSAIDAYVQEKLLTPSVPGAL